MLAMLSTGCAALDDNKGAYPTAEQAYAQYGELVQQGADLRRLAEHWDETARVIMLETADGEDGNLPLERFAGALRYPQLFKVVPAGVTSTVINADQTCVAIEGTSAEGGPLVVQVMLTHIEADWKHSELFVMSAGDGQPMVEHAPCTPSG
jgi:hypothetical protein